MIRFSLAALLPCSVTGVTIVKQSYFLIILGSILLASGAAFSARADGPKAVSQPSPEEIIERTVAKESEFRQARDQYTYVQDVKIETYGIGGGYTGTFRRTSEIVFDDSGKRIEKITYFPVSTAGIEMTPEDLQGFGIVTPFALTRDTLPSYSWTYAGKEKVDELDTYVFDIKPKFMLPLEEKASKGKKLSKGEVGVEGRAFAGRIWVDDRDFQVVKTRGKAVPELKQKFPAFETYREQIDGKYWFPTYTSADDVLDFPGTPVRIKMVVTYSNYRQFSGKITIVDDKPE